jgi:acylphosphatase
LAKHINITVTGKVQGVFFRVYTKKKADETGLSGFVQNEADGSVYIEAEGEEQKLKELSEWCKTGSPNSEVVEVKITEGELKGFKYFNIKKTV